MLWNRRKSPLTSCRNVGGFILAEGLLPVEVQGARGKLSAAIERFFQQALGIVGLRGDDKDVRIDSVVGEIRFMLGQSAGLRGVCADGGPVSRLKTVIDGGCALSVIPFRAFRAECAVDGAFAEARVAAELQSPEKDIPEGARTRDHVQYAREEASKKLGDVGDEGHDDTGTWVHCLMEGEVGFFVVEVLCLLAEEVEWDAVELGNRLKPFSVFGDEFLVAEAVNTTEEGSDDSKSVTQTMGAVEGDESIVGGGFPV